ncbi:MAG: 50S ribosomal protein L25, partial [Pseudomonadota bacterium]
EVNCPANAIPENFSVDLSSAELGDSINISAVTLPDDVEPTITDRDFTLATIATPAGLRSDSGDEDEAEAPAEVEAINQKSDSDEG